MNINIWIILSDSIPPPQEITTFLSTYSGAALSEPSVLH